MNKKDIVCHVILALFVTSIGLLIYLKSQAAYDEPYTAQPNSDAVVFEKDPEFEKILLGLKATELNTEAFNELRNEYTAIPIKESGTIEYSTMIETEKSILSKVTDNSVRRTSGCLIFETANDKKEYCDAPTGDEYRTGDFYYLVGDIGEYYLVQVYQYEYTPLLLINKNTLKTTNVAGGYSMSPNNDYVFSIDYYYGSNTYALLSTHNEPEKIILTSGETEGWYVDEVYWSTDSTSLGLSFKDTSPTPKSKKYIVIDL